ncbi:hypothetical protein BFJ72_g6583 [Fusarium proliferatum]|uniref:Uncharacterized protein n=1 Tax=Gibberella intermedia TaxID=948311 RepID=A0A420TEH7_GIBIN|nr:hypothetical protein BFJ72_g6583 [Fusarium proliferatum]
MKTLMSDVEKAFSTVLGDIGDLVTGQESVADFFTAILRAHELLGVESVQTVFDTFMSTSGSLMSSIEDTLNLPLDIPIPSPLDRLFTGSELTLLDLSCLILSIGLTIIYKIINNESPASALSQSLSPAIISSATKSMLSNTTVELSANHSPLEGMSAMDVDLLQSIGGILFTLEAIIMPVNSL